MPKGFTPDRPGAVVQLDTLTVRPTPERAVKHFTAYDPVSRHTVAHAFRRATAQAAAQFLDKLLAALPYKVHALQVDGGSEFKAEFEAACQQRNLPLYVLPPKSPELNGAVERANGAWRYEFYAVYDTPYDLDGLNRSIDSFAHLYNHYRPITPCADKLPPLTLTLCAAPRPRVSYVLSQDTDWCTFGRAVRIFDEASTGTVSCDRLGTFCTKGMSWRATGSSESSAMGALA